MKSAAQEERGDTFYLFLPNEKIHNCDQCDFRTGGENLLKAHIRNKHGDKNFICEYCD